MQEKQRLTTVSVLLASAVLAWCATARGAEHGSARSVSVRAMRGDHGVMVLGSERPAETLRGQISDATGRSLANVPIELVRFSTQEVRRLPDVTPEQARSWAEEILQATTTDDGRFVLDRLSPGSYSLQVDWSQTPEESSVVVWKLSWIEP